ncbi:hypothetical protein PGT21_020794 [Puccinia graminis f. sp. tritici]|uniref:Uncharacterized protein n=1 Tax=Puccinia graminis f. sp. tritici TaxID=56615 RepID=A0A5B0Q6F5_PUCGR|nr:hypothetical protein PGT21_020794 [Puccinia graminis f. sp. tritici]
MYRHKTGYRNKTSITKIESEPHFLENAVKTSLLAIDEENKQNWEESWRLYKNALNDFHMAHNFPSYFPRCHPLSPPRTPHVTPPTPVGPSTPPAAPKQVSHRRFCLWSAPNPASAPRCSPLFVASPQYTLNPRSAVGRDPRRPPMPEFPAVSFSEPCAFGLSFSAFPRLGKLDFPLMHGRFPQPACVASAPRAFRISAASIPHAPNKPAKALAKARSRHHIPPTLKILSPGSSSPQLPSHSPVFPPCPPAPTVKAVTLLQHPSDRSRRRTRANSPNSHGRPRPPKRPRTATRGNSLDNFVVPDSASVSAASPTPSSRPPSPPPQPPQSSPESPAGSDRMTPRPHESDFSSRPEYRAALRSWASRHHVTQPFYDERLRRPVSSPRRGCPLRGSPRHSPLRRSPRRISDSPVPPSAPAANLQMVPRQPTPERARSPTPVRSPAPADTTIDIEPIVISSGPPTPMDRSPVHRSPPDNPMRIDPELEDLRPTPPPSVGDAPERTTPDSSPPPRLNFLHTPRPAERGPSEVPGSGHSRAITPRPVVNNPPFAPTRTNPFPASRHFRHDSALRELFPDEDESAFDAIPATVVEAVIEDIQGRFETILSASVLPPALRRSTYAAFLSDLRDLRRHRLQVMAVFNPRSANYPDGNGDDPAPGSGSS